MDIQIDLKFINGAIPAEIASRIENLVPAFENIVNEWANTNREMFQRAEGQQMFGAEVSTDLFWQGLTPDYARQKGADEFPDWLMVRTGSLMESLSDPNQFFHAETPQQAVFGIPTDPGDEAKAGGNWKKRPTIVLKDMDIPVIRKNLQDYFSLGENYREIMFQRGLASAYNRKEAGKMDMDFRSTVIPPDVGE